MNEAVWIHQQITKFGLDQKATHCLNLGSSTRQYREIRKPYINELLIKPLTRFGIVNNVDAKVQDGVDEVGDFCDRAFIEKLTSKQYDLVLCNNLLTHVTCRQAVFEIIQRCLREGGYTIVTAPSLYPYCADPYDAKYRPSVEDIQHALPNLELVGSKTIYSDETHAQRLKKNPRLMVGLGLNVLVPAFGNERWRSVTSDLPNIFKQFQTTCVIMRKKALPNTHQAEQE